jgi:predicted aspartyl protease
MQSLIKSLVLTALPLAALAGPGVVTARVAPQPHGLIISGTIAEGGVPNRFSEAIDLRSGFNKYTEQMGDSEQHYGFNRQPWVAGNGIVTVSNLPSAVSREATNAWLDQKAWQEKRILGGPLSRRIVPRGGNAVNLRFDPATGLLEQATVDADDGPRTITYGDWRRVGPYTYPFRRDQVAADGERSTLLVQSARFLASLPAGSLTPPRRHSHAIPPPKGAVSVPFEGTGRRGTHILVSGSVNGKPARFIFDTGGANYLISDVAPQFGVHPTGGVNIGGVGESSNQGGFATVDRVSMGDAALRDEVVVVGPTFFPPAKPGAPPNPVGVTGYEFLAEYLTTIDYPRQELRFSNSLPRISKGLRVPFYNDGSHIYVKAKIDGVEGLYGLDTGDGGTVTVFPTFASRFGIKGARGTVATSGSGAGGNVRSQPGVLNRFSLGGLNFDQLPVEFSHQKAGAFASRSLAGNLGGGVLQCFSITIDFPHHLLLLDPAPDSPHCAPGGKVHRA